MCWGLLGALSAVCVIPSLRHVVIGMDIRLVQTRVVLISGIHHIRGRIRCELVPVKLGWKRFRGGGIMPVEGIVGLGLAVLIPRLSLSVLGKSLPNVHRWISRLVAMIITVLILGLFASIVGEFTAFLEGLLILPTMAIVVISVTLPRSTTTRLLE